MDYLYLALKFLIGGGIIVGVTLLAGHVDPKYGAILVSAPIITILALVFTYNEAGQEVARQLMIGAFWFMIPTLLFVLALYYFMGRFPVLPSVGGAFGIWLAAVFVVNRAIAGC
ncbi:MAG TPA: DUF3147 family protein [Methanoregula sp.]|nr:DUF3147 family protein [Methanoregula sp.]